MAALAAFWLVVPFGSFDTIIGDNICQVGYWRVLQHPTLTGSLAAASMKPALILLLGPAHDLSVALFDSTVLIKAVFALAGAALATIVARIAREHAGPVAGAGAVVYLLTGTPIPEMFTRGTSMIVFLPLLLTGVWLFSRERQLAGSIVLCVAALVRIEAFAVLLWLAIAEQLLARRWRAFIVTSLAVGLALVITVVVYYRLQGSVARFNAGNPAAGYFYMLDPSVLSRFVSTLEFTASSTYQMLFKECGWPFLAVPALVALALSPARRFYLSLLAIPLFLIVYLTAGQGSPEARYFEFMTPMVAVFGPVGVARALRFGRVSTSSVMIWLLPVSALSGVACFVFGGPALLCSVSVLFIAAGAASVFGRLPFVVPAWALGVAWGLLFLAVFVSTARSGGWEDPRRLASYTIDAKTFVDRKLVPRGASVLMDDDILYGVLVRDHELLGRAGTLQYLNAQDDDRRAEILAGVDYLVFSRGSHSFYYLNYDPLRRRKSDPLRAAVKRARHDKPARVYGFRLVPFKKQGQLFVLKVEKA